MCFVCEISKWLRAMTGVKSINEFDRQVDFFLEIKESEGIH